jgi:hypothetical protein
MTQGGFATWGPHSFVAGTAGGVASAGTQRVGARSHSEQKNPSTCNAQVDVYAHTDTRTSGTA